MKVVTDQAEVDRLVQAALDRQREREAAGAVPALPRTQDPEAHQRKLRDRLRPGRHLIQEAM